jgi:hypothetical protein
MSRKGKTEHGIKMGRRRYRKTQKIGETCVWDESNMEIL